jgi:hypothetical protein
MVMVMRVAGNNEDKGGKMITTATRVTSKWTATARKRAMATAMREAREEEGNGMGGKSDCDGKEEGDGKEDGNSKQRQ